MGNESEAMELAVMSMELEELRQKMKNKYGDKNKMGILARQSTRDSFEAVEAMELEELRQTTRKKKDGEDQSLTRQSTADALNVIAAMELDELRSDVDGQIIENKEVGVTTTEFAESDQKSPTEQKLRRLSTNAALKLVEAYELEEDREQNVGRRRTMSRQTTVESLNAVENMELEELRQKMRKEDGEEKILGKNVGRRRSVGKRRSMSWQTTIESLNAVEDIELEVMSMELEELRQKMKNKYGDKNKMGILARQSTRDSFEAVEAMELEELRQTTRKKKDGEDQS